MAETEDADPGRLSGRRFVSRAPGGSGEIEDPDAREADDDAEIEAVTRLLGFLRGDDDEA